eukprot:TRINITY_DN4388_c5_g1_i1.p1 TRINITY_DN4388_c5_g1~~TRINITY_DN4388_c5_g1_i1.p1  ORF type:complete len:293 (-),score=27.00 TRINITY_DN4388_c5_g1_i1:226-1104(-)
MEFDQDLGFAVHYLHKNGGRYDYPLKTCPDMHENYRLQPRVTYYWSWTQARQAAAGLFDPFHMSRFVNERPEVQTTLNMSETLSAKLITSHHFQNDKHEVIFGVLDMIKHLSGAFVEIGVFQGGTAASVLKYLSEVKATRPAYLLDTFEGFEYAEAKDSADMLWAFRDKHLLFKEPQEWMAYLRSEVLGPLNYPFQLIKSNIITDDLPISANPIAAAHIDVDMYEATLVSMEKVAERLQIGGVMLMEDPLICLPYLAGAYGALQEFMDGPYSKHFTKVRTRWYILLIKISAT